MIYISAEAGRGAAAAGNTQPADVLVTVTESPAGTPVSDLAQANFTIISHFMNPGQACGFSNNVTMFTNIGTGAYQLQVSLAGCTWVPGDFLLQVIVSAAADRQGQTVAKFTIP